jgi:hypothetical protein
VVVVVRGAVVPVSVEIVVEGVVKGPDAGEVPGYFPYPESATLVVCLLLVNASTPIRAAVTTSTLTSDTVTITPVLDFLGRGRNAGGC